MTRRDSPPFPVLINNLKFNTMTNFQFNVAHTKVSRELQSIARDVFGKEARELTPSETGECFEIMNGNA